MLGSVRRAIFRLAEKPGKDRKFLLWFQKRRWRFWGRDWYPTCNATRRIEIDVIDLIERAMYLIEVDHPKAKAWEDFLYQKFITGDLRDGKGPWFEDDYLNQEEELPDVSKRFDEVKKMIALKGNLNFIDRPEFRGHRTAYFPELSKRIPEHLVNRELIAKKYEADMAVPYVNRDSQSGRKGKPNQGGQQNQGQQQPGQGNKSQGNPNDREWENPDPS